jgi:hypothetical protein
MLYHTERAYIVAYVRSRRRPRRFRKMWQRRVADAWKSGEVGYGNGHLTRPYNSHGNRIWHKIAEVGIALYGEVPEAETWLDYAVNKFYAAYPVWSDDDGGWHEGASYLTGYMTKVTSCTRAHCRSTTTIFEETLLRRDLNITALRRSPEPPASDSASFLPPVQCDSCTTSPAQKAPTPWLAAAAHWASWLEKNQDQSAERLDRFLYAAKPSVLPVPSRRPMRLV